MTPKIEPDKIIYYPVPGSPAGGVLYLFGNPASKTIALISAGFPDDPEIFLPFASKLALDKESDTLVGVTCLPGYYDRKDHPWTDYKKDGFTFDEMANALREATKSLLLYSTYKGPGKPKIIGIFHDWAVVPGCMWANRATTDGVNAPDELVLFDVLPSASKQLEGQTKPRLEPYKLFMTLFYRVLLALSFLAQRYLGNIVAVPWFIISTTFMGLCRLSPTLDIDAKVFKTRQTPMELKRIIYMTYPYVKLFKCILQGGKGLGGARLPSDLSAMPVLYMYGTEKRVMFHDDESKAVLEMEQKEKRSKSNAIAVDGAGHWLYSDGQKPDYCFDCVKKFMMEK